MALTTKNGSFTDYPKELCTELGSSVADAIKSVTSSCFATLLKKQKIFDGTDVLRFSNRYCNRDCQR